MMVLRVLEGGRLVDRPLDPSAALPRDALWVDVLKPTAEEIHAVERFGLSVPPPEALVEIEATSRFFEDEEGLHLRSYFLQELAEGGVNVTVHFTVSKGRLFTFHYQEVPTFDDFAQQLQHKPELAKDPFAVILGILETRIDRVADVLERLYAETDDFSRRVFQVEETDLEIVVNRLAGTEDLNGKARLSLMDKQRVLSRLVRNGIIPLEHRDRLKEILRDVASLIEHSTSLFEKIRFLMDVTMGRINVEQNKIIKIFSIAAVVFLPPTLVASIYGMNFRFMPELHWHYGYPFAVVLMVLSGIAPYLLFKRKGWL